MIENKFDDHFGDGVTKKKGNCDRCRTPFYHDLEIYCIVYDIPKEGLGRILASNNKNRLCRKCYAVAYNVVEACIFGPQSRNG